MQPEHCVLIILEPFSKSKYTHVSFVLSLLFFTNTLNIIFPTTKKL